MAAQVPADPPRPAFKKPPNFFATKAGIITLICMVAVSGVIVTWVVLATADKRRAREEFGELGSQVKAKLSALEEFKEAKGTPDSIRAAVLVMTENEFESKIIGAAISASKRIAYVESKTKDGGANPHGFGGRHIDVSIRIHQIDADGTDRSVEIESYNPFFGCDVRFFEWIGDTVVLIYREMPDAY